MDDKPEAPDLKKHAAVLWNGKDYILSMPKNGDEMVSAQAVVLATLMLRLTQEEGFYQQQIEWFESRLPDEAQAGKGGES